MSMLFCLLSGTRSSLERNESAPHGNKYFPVTVEPFLKSKIIPYTVDPFSEGDYMRKQTGSLLSVSCPLKDTPNNISKARLYKHIETLSKKK